MKAKISLAAQAFLKEYSVGSDVPARGGEREVLQEPKFLCNVVTPPCLAIWRASLVFPPPPSSKNSTGRKSLVGFSRKDIPLQGTTTEKALLFEGSLHTALDRHLEQGFHCCIACTRRQTREKVVLKVLSHWGAGQCNCAPMCHPTSLCCPPHASWHPGTLHF